MCVSTIDVPDHYLAAVCPCFMIFDFASPSVCVFHICEGVEVTVAH